MWWIVRCAFWALATGKGSVDTRCLKHFFGGQMSSSKWQWVKVLDTTLWTHQFFQIFALRESNMAMENILFIGDYRSETPISSGFPASRVWLPQGTHSCWWISHSFWQVILSFVTKIIQLEFYTLKAYPNIFTHHIPNWEAVLEYIYSIR